MHPHPPLLFLFLFLLSTPLSLALPAAPDSLGRRQTQTTPGCNRMFTPANCGACHYWRGCLTKQGTWITPW